MPIRHSDAVNMIRIAISEMGGVALPYTVGKFRALDSNRVVKVGIEGVSDIVACIGGKFIGVEVKVEGDRHREGQKTFRDAIEKAGGKYILARFSARENGVETLKCSLNT